MKDASVCESIEDIRKNIDHIDKQIVSLLAKRAEYVKAASSFKKKKSDVLASDRVKMMMAERRNWAVENNISPDFIEQLFKEIVNFYIHSEILHWEKSNCNGAVIAFADENDVEDIYYLQKRAFVQEAEKNNTNYLIVPLLQTLEQFRNEFKEFVYLKVVSEQRIVGSARALVKEGVCYIGRVIVEPVFQRCGYGCMLLEAVEKNFPEISCFELFTAEKSVGNVSFYKKNGYGIEDRFVDETGVSMAVMRKRRS
jgi:chorismate mutase-like protein